MKERVQVARSVTRCPYCHDDLKVEKEVVACAPCGARHHRDCHAEHGRCASCGAVEALYPRAPEKRSARSISAEPRLDPPRGSSISVVKKSGRVEYRWPVKVPGELIMILIFCVIFLPFGLYLLYKFSKGREFIITLAPTHLVFPGRAAGQNKVSAVVLTRSSIDRVQVVNDSRGGCSLFIDEGVARFALASGDPAPCLTAPEVEWLKERIEAWRAKA